MIEEITRTIKIVQLELEGEKYITGARVIPLVESVRERLESTRLLFEESEALIGDFFLLFEESEALIGVFMLLIRAVFFFGVFMLAVFFFILLMPAVFVAHPF